MAPRDPAREKADYNSNNVDEIAALYHSIGAASYSDHTSLSFLRERPEECDPFDVTDDELAEEMSFMIRINKKHQIDSILLSLTHNELDNNRIPAVSRMLPLSLPNSTSTSNGCIHVGRPRISSPKFSIPNLFH